MKKRFFLIILGIITCFSIWSQSNPSDPTNDESFTNYTPEGLLDYVFDLNGEKIKLKDIVVGQERVDSTGHVVKSVLFNCNTGYYNLYIEDGSGFEELVPTDPNYALHQARRAVLCQVFKDISDFIPSPLTNNTTKVNFWIRNLNLIISNASSSSVLGMASGYFNLPSSNPTGLGGIADNEIWKTIHAGIDSYTNVTSPIITQSGTFYHGKATINFSNQNINYYTNLANTVVPVGQYDLYTVLLHEITHALGFATLIKDDGGSVFGAGYNYYSRYDLFLKNNAGNQNLIVNSGSCSLYDYQFNPSLPLTTIAPGGCVSGTSSNSTVCGSSVKYSGATNVSVYTPNCFEAGSSLSHFEDFCFPTYTNFYGNDVYFVLANSIPNTLAKRYLKPEERLVLCDLGYQVNTTFGSTAASNFYNYQTSSCSGIDVAGINDGLNSNGTFVYFGATGSNIIINDPALSLDILANDYNAVSFECLEDVYDIGASFNNNSGSSITQVVFTPSSPGIHILRYVPISAAGEKGNITYIYVNVYNGNCIPTSCNLINNGDFESYTNCTYSPTSLSMGCWQSYFGSPDIFDRNCTISSPNAGYWLDIPTVRSNPPSDTWNIPGNDNFMGLLSMSNYYGESIQTNLNTPIVANTYYTVRFRAKTANDPYLNGSIGYTGVSTVTFGGSEFPMASTGMTNSLPNGIENLLTVSIPNDNQWHYFTQQFIYNSALPTPPNLNNLYLLNSSNLNNTGQGYLYLDDIVVSQTDISFTLPTVLCINQIINLNNCLNSIPSNVTFSGNGVSFNNGNFYFDPVVAGVGTHVITCSFTGSNGCSIELVDEITVVNSTINVGLTASSTNVCASTPVTLTATGATNYTWQPGNMAGNSVVVTPNATTLYTVTGELNGCTATAAVTINVTTINVGITSSVNPVCSGQQVALTPSGASTYILTTPSGNLNSTGAPFSVTPTTTTTYQMQGTNAQGCAGFAQITVTTENCIVCTSCTNTIGSTSVIPSGTYTNQVYCLNNNATISGNVILSQSEVKIASNVKITVPNGASLTIQGSHLYSCDQMWKGIEVQAGGKVFVTPYPATGTPTKTSLIEDAITAIDFLPIPTQLTNQILSVVNATFNKNKVSINIQSYPFSNANTVVGIKNSLFTSRVIYNPATPNTWPLTNTVKTLNGTTDPLDKPYININATGGYPLTSLKLPYTGRPDVGIILKNVSTTSGSGPFVYNEVNIGSTVAGEYNLFDNLNGGVDLLNSNIKIQNCKFQDPKKIVISGTPTGFAFGINAVCNDQIKYKLEISSECAFYNQNRAIKADYYHEVLVTGNTFRSQRTITHSAAPLSSTIPGRYGIYIRCNDYKNFTLTNNTLYNIEKGIYIGAEIVPLVSTPLIVIEQNTIAANYPGYTITTNSVFDAIQVVNVNSLPYSGTVNIMSNSISDVYRGILAQMWNRSNLTVTTNTITLTDQANDPEQYAIAFKGNAGGSLKNTISLNYITGFTGSTTYTLTSGIKLESSYSNHLECNNTYNTYNGLLFTGNTFNTSTKRNTMNNNKYGFVLDGAGVTLGNQGSPTAPCDNIWSGTVWDATGTVNGEFKTLVASGADAENSKMYIRSTNLNIASSFNPNGSAYNIPNSTLLMTYAPTNNALFIASGVATSCNSAYIPEDSTLVVEEAAAQIEMAVFSMETSTMTEEELAKQETDVYRSLDASPELLNESITLQEFYDSTAISNKGSLLDAEKAYATGNDSLTETILNTVAPTDQIEYNYKLFYSLSLKYSDSTFTPIDSLDLYNLAIACPDKDGNIVYQARSLYNSIYATAETFESVCAESYAKSLTNLTDALSDKENGFIIYPNPNIGEFLVYVTDESVTSLTAILRDVSGKLLYKSTMEIIDNKLKMNYIAQSGMYYLELINPMTNKSFTEKIMILK